jgi:hypothetical protein
MMHCSEMRCLGRILCRPLPNKGLPPEWIGLCVLSLRKLVNWFLGVFIQT